jgi:hypothetical protein
MLGQHRPDQPVMIGHHPRVQTPSRRLIAAEPSMSANKNIRVCVATSLAFSPRLPPTAPALKPPASATARPEHHTSAAALSLDSPFPAQPGSAGLSVR